MGDVLDFPVFSQERLWNADMLNESHDWRYVLSDEDRRCVMDAVHRSRAYEREHIPADALRGTSLAAALARVSATLDEGRGIFLLRGLNVDDYSEDDLARAFWIVGSSIGVPVSQTRSGERLRRVEDLGKDAGSPLVRGHETRAELPFHSDRCDVVALLCVRTAAQGGISRVVSGATVHERIRRERPDLLPV